MLGDRIKRARKKIGLTQEDIANKIGVKRSVISKYENGLIEPSISQLKKIADALDVPWYELYSDSSYVVNSINERHLHKWIEENDETKKNMDLWREIYKLINKHKVKFYWVKGHNDNEFNELADLYANNSSMVLNPKKDLPDDY